MALICFLCRLLLQLVEKAYLTRVGTARAAQTRQMNDEGKHLDLDLGARLALV